ncbi:MAG: hypothetical protein JXA41_12920 [Deltaproteobacteria bacterium]|nr:hypothetical protein [Deltaproteobacteria bacterium]
MIFNELLEALMCADIPKRARRLIDVQMRFSFGCGPKTFTALTKSEYAALAVLDWSDVHRALHWLLEKRIFEQDERDMKRYRLNKYYRDWLVRVGMRDVPAYKTRLNEMVRRHLNLPSAMSDEPGKSPDEEPGESPDELPGKTPDQSGEMPDQKPGETPDAENTSIWQNTRRKSGETPDGNLAKRQTERGNPHSKSSTCARLKKRERKDKDNKEEVLTYFFFSGIGGLLDGHPFFSQLKKDAEFWNALNAAYPDLNIPAQIHKMTAWLIANPEVRYKTYKRFIQGWLAREEREEKNYGEAGTQQRRKDRHDPEEKPAPFSDIPPELIA